jgi:hypothetical protein
MQTRNVRLRLMPVMARGVVGLSSGGSLPCCTHVNSSRSQFRHPLGRSSHLTCAKLANAKYPDGTTQAAMGLAALKWSDPFWLSCFVAADATNRPASALRPYWSHGVETYLPGSTSGTGWSEVSIISSGGCGWRARSFGSSAGPNKHAPFIGLFRGLPTLGTVLSRGARSSARSIRRADEDFDGIVRKVRFREKCIAPARRLVGLGASPSPDPCTGHATIFHRLHRPAQPHLLVALFSTSQRSLIALTPIRSTITYRPLPSAVTIEPIIGALPGPSGPTRPFKRPVPHFQASNISP